MRPNASGTTRANTSLTIGSLNDRKIFVTRSSAGSITCGTIHKRSKAYFVLFFNSHVELLMRAYIVNGFPSTSDCYLLGLVNLRMLRFRTNCGKTGSDPLREDCPSPPCRSSLRHRSTL